MEGWRKEWWRGEKAKEKKKQWEGRKEGKSIGGELRGKRWAVDYGRSEGKRGPLEAEV